MVDEEIKRNIILLNTDDNISDTLNKKTLEENNKERDINLFTENNDSSRFKNMTFKYSSAPVSNKNSDCHESIFSNSMKFAAFRASEMKKRNKDFIRKYGNPEMVDNTRYQHEFLKILHSSALTVQNHWRDFILKKRSLNTEENNECMSSLKKSGLYYMPDNPNNNRSTSRNGCNIPKLDLSQVASKKDSHLNNSEGLFAHESMLDLSTKRMQQLILSSDLPSMLKVREEGVSHKYKKERSKIQKLLSSQKISPRTGNFQELELEKWVDQELRDIDRTKKIYEENRK